MVLPPDVIFVIHQIGSGADGGIQSISELIFNTPQLRKLIVTNIETPASARWQAHAEVRVWANTESRHAVAGKGLLYRVLQVWHRVLNNLKIARLLRQTGARVVHCNDRRSFWNVVFGARLAGANVILNVRDTMRRDQSSRLLWRMALRLCDLFLVLSREMQESWIAALAPLSRQPRQLAKFRYVYSIVDTAVCKPVQGPERTALREQLGIEAGRFAIVYVARVDRKKAQLAFIRQTVPLLVREIPGVSVHFVGDFRPEHDAYCAACAAAVQELGLEDVVRFEGYSPRAADWYGASDIVVLASEREGLPRAVIEGIACGATVVAFDVCSVREVLEARDCGRAVAMGDYEELGMEIIDLSRDDAERIRLGKQGVGVARELFRADVAGRQYADIVHRLAGLG